MKANSQPTSPNWIGEAGDATTARDQYAALLRVHERVSGIEYPDTLIVRADLAHWTGMTDTWAAEQ